MISKQLGFRMAFQGGLSFNINDLIIPDIKEELLDNAKVKLMKYGITITWVLLPITNVTTR